MVIADDLSTFVLRGFKYTVEINVKNSELKSAFETKEESYKVEIKEGKAILEADHYVGFVHALETFYQSIECGKFSVKNCTMKKLPIKIED